MVQVKKLADTSDWFEKSGSSKKSIRHLTIWTKKHVNILCVLQKWGHDLTNSYSCSVAEIKGITCLNKGCKIES